MLLAVARRFIWVNAKKAYNFQKFILQDFVNKNICLNWREIAHNIPIIMELEHLGGHLLFWNKENVAVS